MVITTMAFNNSCTLALDARLHTAALHEQKSAQQAMQGESILRPSRVHEILALCM